MPRGDAFATGLHRLEDDASLKRSDGIPADFADKVVAEKKARRTRRFFSAPLTPELKRSYDRMVGSE